MPTLATLNVDQGELLQVDIFDNSQVEPISGPEVVDALMDRFPEEVYTQGRDTHLFKFISAMCGDAGAGLLKRQAFVARLRFEGELLTFRDLDVVYTHTLKFPRLRDEIYDYDPDVDVLQKSEWDEIAAKDEKYKRRVMDFFNGLRLGSSPEGISLVAKSATGLDVEVAENYKAVFDSITDDPLGLQIQGQTASVYEYILTPRILDENGNPVEDKTYSSTLQKTKNVTTGADVWTVGAANFLDPDIEFNMINILDQVRPVGALMTVKNTNVNYKDVHIQAIDASSTRAFVARFVTGSDDVPWPDVDSAGNFIERNIEKEAPLLPLSGIELPTIYYTIEGISAYIGSALDDPTYGTEDFYTMTHNVSPYLRYKSEHTGKFYPVISSIFPFLKTVSDRVIFAASQGLATQDTQLILEGRGK